MVDCGDECEWNVTDTLQLSNAPRQSIIQRDRADARGHVVEEEEEECAVSDVD